MGDDDDRDDGGNVLKDERHFGLDRGAVRASEKPPPPPLRTVCRTLTVKVGTLVLQRRPDLFDGSACLARHVILSKIHCDGRCASQERQSLPPPL